jgi:steroid delta-isomerase-like uncharacterized protein
MPSEQNQSIVRRFFDEMCNGRKLALADEIYSTNHVLHDPSSPVGPGPQGLKDLVGLYQRAFPDARWTVDELFTANGERVVVQWTGSGTQNGELMGIAPTRKSVRVTGTWVFKITGGKIVESWNHWDCLGMLQQLGVVPSLVDTKK